MRRYRVAIISAALIVVLLAVVGQLWGGWAERELANDPGPAPSMIFLPTR